MRKLAWLVVRMAQRPGLLESGRLIDQLTDLETEGLARNISWRSIETIRATRLKLRVEGLIPKLSLPLAP